MAHVPKKTEERDLHDYNSRIKRADGVVPYNGHFWPTESWWPGHQPRFCNSIAGQWNFGIIALNDGRFSVEGSVCQIEHNDDNPYAKKDETKGRPVVFATREEAIRVACARMIRDMLASRFWSRMIMENISPRTMSAVINWCLAQVANATQGPSHRKICLPEPKQVPKPSAFAMRLSATVEAYKRGD